jgi:phosphoribosylpyrophosphate synthetase
MLTDSSSLLGIKNKFRSSDENAKFILDTINSIELNDIKFDIILSPNSSSAMVNFVTDTISKKYGKPHLSGSFIKSLPSEITFSTGGDVLKEETLIYLLNFIQKAKSIGVFNLKHIKPVQFRKYFNNLFTSVPDLVKIVDKNILIVDDIITSGSTMNDIYKVLMAHGANNITGLTFLKK